MYQRRRWRSPKRTGVRLGARPRLVSSHQDASMVPFGTIETTSPWDFMAARDVGILSPPG
jgi:hypothetical protein